MIRSTLAAALLAAPAAAATAPLVSVEAASALFLRDDPQGSLYEAEFAWGARATLALEPLFPLPEPLRLDAGLLWYGASRVDGTDAVQVRRGLNTFAMPLRGGWELAWRPFDTLRLAPYVTAGPAATRTGVEYRVSDPEGLRLGLPPQVQDAADWKAGALYGAGLSVRGPAAALELVGRLEILRLHRGPSTDLSLGAGFGLAF